jgi:beta-galactosidase/beta-glucuronidase
MYGGCVHHDNGPLGSMAIDRAEERRVEILKSHGYNAIRTSHNPVSPAFLDACDRLGMLVMNEAFDCWAEGKNPQDYHVFFDDWWRRDLATLVLRDRNHPSVVMWSIGNGEQDRHTHTALLCSAVSCYPCLTQSSALLCSAVLCSALLCCASMQCNAMRCRDPDAL